MTGRWILLAVLAASAFALRSAPVLGPGARGLPAPVERISALLAPAIIAAMFAASVTLSLREGTTMPGGAAARLLALGVAVGVATRTRSTGLVLASGLAAHWLVVGLGGA